MHFAILKPDPRYIPVNLKLLAIFWRHCCSLEIVNGIILAFVKTFSLRRKAIFEKQETLFDNFESINNLLPNE